MLRNYREDDEFPGYVWLNDDTLVPKDRVQEYERGGIDTAPLTSKGVGMTSGYRDPEYNKRVGGVEGSLHTKRDAIDLVPGKSGLSMDQLYEEARSLYPDADELINEGDHVHLAKAGWGGAPDIRGKGVTFDAPEAHTAAIDPSDPLTPLRRAVEAQQDPESRQLAAEIMAERSGIELTPELMGQLIPSPKISDEAEYEVKMGTDPFAPKFGQVIDETAPDIPEEMRAGYRGLFANGVPTADDIRAYFLAQGQEVLNADAIVEKVSKGATVNDKIKRLQEQTLSAPDEALVGTAAESTRGAMESIGLPQPLADAAGDAVGIIAEFSPLGDVDESNRYQHAADENAKELFHSGVGGFFKNFFGGIKNQLVGDTYGALAATPFAGAAGKGAKGIKTIGREALSAIAETKPVQSLLRNWEYVKEAGRAPTSVYAVRSLDDGSILTWTSKHGAAEAERVKQLEPDKFEVVRVSPDDVETPPPGGTVPPGGTGGPETPRGDMAGNINLKYLTDDKAIRNVIYGADDIGESFMDARRGVVSEDATAELANDLGWSYDDLLKRRKGQAFSAEEALRSRQLLHQSGEEVATLAARAAGEGGDEAVLQFQEALTRHVAIQEQVSGMTAEAGRALRQFQMRVGDGLTQQRITREMIERLGGEGNIRDVARKLNELAGEVDPGQFNTAVRAAVDPKLKDYFEEIFYNFLLSGPRTHVVNITSNLITSMLQVPEHAVASAVGKADELLTGQTDRILSSEVGARALGMLQGVREGADWAKRAWKTDESFDAVSKLDRTTGNPLGKFAVATRALQAEDEFFKGVARRMELSALAVRQVKKEGLTGQEAQTRIAELIANPPEDLMERAIQYSRYVTFQQPLGDIGKAGQAFLNKWAPLKVIVPFVRTPVNLFKFAAERSPLALVMPSVWKSWKAGGEKKHLAIARALMGSGFGATAAMAAQTGIITGGMPNDPNQTKLQRADGWQPYSVKIGDKYVSYARLDPFATTIGWAADFAALNKYMTDEEAEDYAKIVSASIAEQLSNKTYLSGISDFMSAINQPDQQMTNWASSIAGMAVPNILAQATQTIDPTSRETRADTMLETIKQKVMSRVPGLSDNLQARRDVWGEPIVNEQGAAGIVSPFFTTTAKGDPTNEKLIDAQASVNDPNRTVKVGGVDIKLPRKTFNKYKALRGRVAKLFLDELTSSPDWERMDGEERRKAIEDAMQDAGKEARGMMFDPLFEEN